MAVRLSLSHRSPQAVRHEVLEHPAQEHVERERQPERVVADYRVADVEDAEVGRRGPEHRVAHDARLGRLRP